MSCLLALLLVASTFMGVFTVNVQAHSIVVDGDPTDWLADSSGQSENTGMYYSTGEYVWVDAMGDDIGDGDYQYPTDPFFLPGMVDIREFRVTYDDSRIYFLIKLGNITNAWNAPEGFCSILATIHIDQDRIPASGQEWAAQSMDSKFDSSCWWEYVIVLHGFGSWIMDSGWNTVGWTGNGMQVAGSVDNNCIEVAVDYSVIGSFVGQTWRFMVEVGFEEYANFREVQEMVGGWAPGGGVPTGDNDWVESDAFDACFYESTAGQVADWSDYDQSAGTPTIFCNTGEGYADISSTDIPFIREVSRPIQLTTDSHYDRDQSFFISSDGTYWLFFTRGRGDPSAPGYNPDSDFYDIYYLKSTDEGASWIEYSMPDFVNDPYGQREVAAFEDSGGKIWVFFTDAFYGDPYGTPTHGIYYTTTTDGGSTWSSVQQVPGITGVHIDALEAFGKIWVFYEDGAIIYCVSFDGTSWSAPTQISESGKHGGIPKAMLDNYGVLNVVWCGWTEGGIYRSTSTDGVSWSTPQLILTSSYIACDPVLVQDSDGTYWLFWAPWDSATDSQWLEAVYSPDGVTWSSSIHVTSGGYDGNYWWDMWPEAYITSDGDMLLFYTSEVASGSYVKGDGNIWMYKIDWDLKNPHYEFIQNAINAANPGDTIIVHEGTYAEQIIIDKELTIEGQGDTTIIKPSAADSFTLFSRKAGGSDNTAAIVVVNANATIKNLKIDGSEIGSVPSGATMFVGILYRGVNGTIDSVTIDGINITNGNAIYLSSMGNNVNVEVKGCTILNFYKNGITANYEGLTVNIHDNNIIGSGPRADVAQNGIQIGFGATGSVMKNTVSNIAYTGEDYEAVGILFVDSNGTAIDNTVTNCQAGIVAQAGWYPPVTCNVIIENNTIDATDLTGLSYIVGTGAVTWDDDAAINVTIKNNDLTGAGYGEGVSIGSEWATGTVNAIIKGNDISNWGDGVWIGPTSNEIKINFNNIEGNVEYGVYNGITVTVDARFNWWGDASGPSGMGLGAGDAISENVTYSPWLGYPYGTVPMTYHVDPTGKIQDAINAASPGDTIKVHEGTYTEQLIINKSLTLIGDPMPKIVAPDTRATFTIPESSATFDPIIFAYGSLTGTETISVTIEGFEIDGGNKAASGYRFVGILYRNVKPGAISNNVLHSLYPPSGKGSGPETVGILIYGDSEVEIYQNKIRDFSSSE